MTCVEDGVMDNIYYNSKYYIVIVGNTIVPLFASIDKIIDNQRPELSTKNKKNSKYVNKNIDHTVYLSYYSYYHIFLTHCFYQI